MQWFMRKWVSPLIRLKSEVRERNGELWPINLAIYVLGMYWRPFFKISLLYLPPLYISIIYQNQSTLDEEQEGRIIDCSPSYSTWYSIFETSFTQKPCACANQKIICSTPFLITVITCNQILFFYFFGMVKHPKTWILHFEPRILPLQLTTFSAVWTWMSGAIQLPL